MGFYRKEYWSELLIPPPGDVLDLGIEPVSPVYSSLKAEFFTTEPPGKPWTITLPSCISILPYTTERNVVGVCHFLDNQEQPATSPTLVLVAAT